MYKEDEQIIFDRSSMIEQCSKNTLSSADLGIEQQQKKERKEANCNLFRCDSEASSIVSSLFVFIQWFVCVF